MIHSGSNLSRSNSYISVVEDCEFIVWSLCTARMTPSELIVCFLAFSEAGDYNRGDLFLMEWKLRGYEDREIEEAYNEYFGLNEGEENEAREEIIKESPPGEGILSGGQ